MKRQELEEKLPTMTQAQLIETVKTCLDMIERLENDLSAGTHKLEEMTALVKKLSEDKSL
jgi:CO dehydrogenase/acetyl-CoA synthase epsilon subunit